MESIHIIDLEAAINHWRARSESGPGMALAAPVSALAQVYAQMIVARSSHIVPCTLPAAALQAWLAWYDSLPDTPCIAICSTSQGDQECKGCGRSFAEVQQWLALSPYAKRAVWRRKTAERAAENR